MREDNGKKIQVVTKSTTGDYEGLIKTKQGYKTALSTINGGYVPRMGSRCNGRMPYQRIFNSQSY